MYICIKNYEIVQNSTINFLINGYNCTLSSKVHPVILKELCPQAIPAIDSIGSSSKTEYTLEHLLNSTSRLNNEFFSLPQKNSVTVGYKRSYTSIYYQSESMTLFLSFKHPWYQNSRKCSIFVISSKLISPTKTQTTYILCQTSRTQYVPNQKAKYLLLLAKDFFHFFCMA